MRRLKHGARQHTQKSLRIERANIRTLTRWGLGASSKSSAKSKSLRFFELFCKNGFRQQDSRRLNQNFARSQADFSLCAWDHSRALQLASSATLHFRRVRNIRECSRKMASPDDMRGRTQKRQRQCTRTCVTRVIQQTVRTYGNL